MPCGPQFRFRGEPRFYLGEMPLRSSVKISVE